MSRIWRRDFLRSVAQAGAGALAFSALPRWARGGPAAASQPPGLIERNDYPQHWETTLEALGRSWITPNGVFFVRSHLPVPAIDAGPYRLEVSGLVRTPLSLSLEELLALPAVEVVHTLECAGNGRGLYRLPSTSGTQWEHGAVGNAAWSGVKLSSLLERAGVRPQGRHVWFEAADQAPLPQAPKFLRSIPLDKAMADVVLAHAMNGRPLPALHGAPLRVIVPGWYGMAWTKWLTRVRVEAAPSDNHFMVNSYRYLYPGGTAAAQPVQELKVKSLITRPLGWARPSRGKLQVEGYAWAGAAGVARVEVSADGGVQWWPAAFSGETRPLAWRAWRAEVPARRGRLALMARATDGAGETQPFAARANAGGYANNSIHQVSVNVRA